MKLKYCGREVTYYKNNKRFDVYFPKGSIFLGKNFAVKRLKAKDVAEILLLMVMPYEFLNNRFMKK